MNTKLYTLAFLAAYYTVCALIIHALAGWGAVLALAGCAALVLAVLYAMHGPSGLYGVHSLAGTLVHARAKERG